MSTTVTPDLQELGIGELRELATEKGIDAANLNRKTIIKRLQEANMAYTPPPAPKEETTSAFGQRAPQTRKEFYIKQRHDLPQARELWDTANGTTLRAATIYARSVAVLGEYAPVDIEGNSALIGNCHKTFNLLAAAAYANRNGTDIDWEAIEALISEIAPKIKE